jgi:hypothetical protein
MCKEAAHAAVLINFMVVQQTDVGSCLQGCMNCYRRRIDGCTEPIRGGGVIDGREPDHVCCKDRLDHLRAS